MGTRLIFLTGVLRDKDWQQMLRRALPLAKAFVVITPPSARALDENELAGWLNAQGVPVPAIPAADTDDGVRRALAMAGKDDAICSWGLALLHRRSPPRALGAVKKIRNANLLK